MSVERCHAGRKLAAMRVLMAACAGQVLPAISDSVSQIGIHALTMAIRANDRKVCSGQREARVLMARKRKRGRAETLHGVARFTTIQKRRFLELPRMQVSVTISACPELDLE